MVKKYFKVLIFCYLELIIYQQSGLEEDVMHRIKEWWLKWIWCIRCWWSRNTL